MNRGFDYCLKVKRIWKKISFLASFKLLPSSVKLQICTLCSVLSLSDVIQFKIRSCLLFSLSGFWCVSLGIWRQRTPFTGSRSRPYRRQRFVWFHINWFHKCSQSGRNSSKHPMISISMANNVISCKKSRKKRSNNQNRWFYNVNSAPELKNDQKSP